MIDAPNYTQIPNVIFDEWMAILSPSEFKVLLCLCRKTFGWHKSSDTVSKRQLMKFTGMTKNTLQSAIVCLEEHGLVQKIQAQTEYGFKPNEYRLNIDKPKSILDDEEDQNLGGGGSPDDPGVDHQMTQGVGQQMTPQKKDSTKETNKETMIHERGFSKEDIKACPELKSQGTLQEKVAFLKNVTFPDRSKICQRNIETWCKLYSLWRMKKSANRILNLVLGGGEITNPEGLFYSILKNPDMESSQEIEEAREAARGFLKEFKLRWRIDDGYVINDSTGKDISLSMGKERVLSELKRWLDV